MAENEKQLAEKLLSGVDSGGIDPESVNVVVGLDGFVDEIVHVVDKRHDAENYSRIGTVREFAGRIASFAEKSGNIEMITRIKKLGGNGPIMANALNTLGTPTTYIGNLGFPDVHPVFEDLASRADVYSLAAPCHTDAVEFNDAKIMFGKMSPIREVTWDRILDVVGLDRLKKILGGTDLLALVNWTMVTYMSDIFEKLIQEICPSLDKNKERYIFFDLADPQKRDDSAIERMLELVKGFSEYYRVIFGLNGREAEQIAKIMGIAGTEDASDPAAAACEAIQSRLSVYCVVVHPIEYAVATIGGKTWRQEGPTTPRPKITTGAGDHFNSGFCLGQALGMDPQTSLLMGVCCSGYYVMTATSPTLRELAGFTADWRDDPFGMME